MPIRWNVPRHAAALHRCNNALVQGAGAVVLVPDGVGKTTLARLAAERLAHRRRSHRSSAGQNR